MGRRRCLNPRAQRRYPHENGTCEELWCFCCICELQLISLHSLTVVNFMTGENNYQPVPQQNSACLIKNEDYLAGGQRSGNYHSGAYEIDFDEVMICLKKPSAYKNFKTHMSNCMIRQGGVFGISSITYSAPCPVSTEGATARISCIMSTSPCAVNAEDETARTSATAVPYPYTEGAPEVKSSRSKNPKVQFA